MTAGRSVERGRYQRASADSGNSRSAFHGKLGDHFNVNPEMAARTDTHGLYGRVRTKAHGRYIPQQRNTPQRLFLSLGFLRTVFRRDGAVGLLPLGVYPAPLGLLSCSISSMRVPLVSPRSAPTRPKAASPSLAR